jgi:hypothetical protein
MNDYPGDSDDDDDGPPPPPRGPPPRPHTWFKHDDDDDDDDSDDDQEQQEQEDEGEKCANMKDADYKFNQTFNYKMAEFENVDKVNGEHITVDEKEKAKLKEIQEELNTRGKTNSEKRKFTSLFDNDDVINSGTDQIKCLLCKCTRTFNGGLNGDGNANNTTQNGRIDLNRVKNITKLRDAIKDMYLYDIMNTGEKHEGQLFQDCANIFNKAQEKLAENGIPITTVDAETVKTHMTEHCVINTLRPIVRNRRIVTDIIKRGKKHIFGTDVEGRHVWNNEKTKLLFKAMDQEIKYSTHIMNMKAFINNNVLNGKANIMSYSVNPNGSNALTNHSGRRGAGGSHAEGGQSYGRYKERTFKS